MYAMDIQSFWVCFPSKRHHKVFMQQSETVEQYSTTTYFNALEITEQAGAILIEFTIPVYIIASSRDS